MDEMQGGGLGVCFLHHHLLPASWNPKASHGAKNGIFENTTYAAQTSFFFYKSVLSETRQVISLMQTAEIFCLKTHEQRIDFAVLPRLVVVPFREDRGLLSRTVASYLVCSDTQRAAFRDVLYEDHDRIETSVIVDRKKFLWQFRRRDSVDKQVSWWVNITDTIQLPNDHIYSRDALRLLRSYMK